MQRRMMVEVFPRNRYLGDSTEKLYYPRERQRLAKLFGMASRVDFHFRVYDRASGAEVTFQTSHGCFGDEMPAEAPRLFAIVMSGQTPALPYDGTSMANLPDDGTFHILPDMGLVDIVAKVSGGANTWVEFAGYATVTLQS